MPEEDDTHSPITEDELAEAIAASIAEANTCPAETPGEPIHVTSDTMGILEVAAAESDESDHISRHPGIDLRPTTERPTHPQTVDKVQGRL